MPQTRTALSSEDKSLLIYFGDCRLRQNSEWIGKPSSMTSAPIWCEQTPSRKKDIVLPNKSSNQSRWELTDHRAVKQSVFGA